MNTIRFDKDAPVSVGEVHRAAQRVSIGSFEDEVLDRVTREQHEDSLEEVISRLTPREQEILRLRFGLDRGAPRTLQEIGDQFGLTRERIRQIEAKAIAALRHQG